MEISSCVQCLMPESVTPLLEETSEEALKERISLRKVTAAVDMYDQLLQSGERTRQHAHTSSVHRILLHQFLDSFRHRGLHGNDPWVVRPDLSLL